jgi:hypothetical protein
MMKRLFAASAVPNEVEANATSVDDWRLERLLKSVAKTCSLNGSLRAAAIRPLAQDSNGSTANSWRHALVSPDCWVVDASNRLGAASR